MEDIKRILDLKLKELSYDKSVQILKEGKDPNKFAYNKIMSKLMVCKERIPQR